MNRFQKTISILTLSTLFLSHSLPVSAIAFRVQTPEQNVQSKSDTFDIERKAYIQLKEQEATDATLVIQGRVVLNAMLDVFRATLDYHESRFDAMKAGGLIDATMTETYVGHKTRITTARNWIDDQTSLTKDAETRKDLQSLATNYIAEWKNFRALAYKARASMLVQRSKLYVAKGEEMLAKVENIHEQMGDAELQSDDMDATVVLLRDDLKRIQDDVIVLDAKLTTLMASDVTEDENGLTATEYYNDVMAELKVCRGMFLTAQTNLETFKTQAQALLGL